jgi:hypothetical protein
MTAALTTVVVALVAAITASAGVWTWPVALLTVGAAGPLAWRAQAGIAYPVAGRLAPGLMVALGLISAGWAGLTHSEKIVVYRDAASYFHTAIALATGHQTPFGIDAAAYGGSAVLGIPGVTLSSAAFYDLTGPADPTIQPQFLVGAPAWYSIGHWLAGIPGVWWTGAAFGGLSVLSVGLIASRLVTKWAGPFAALAAALCYPMLQTSRTTFSEPFALFLTAMGLLALAEATDRRHDRDSTARLGTIAGILIAGSQLFRIDSLREVMLATIVIGVLVVLRHPVARPFGRALAAMTLTAVLIWMTQSRAYLLINKSSVVPLVMLAVAVVGVVALVALLSSRGVRVPTQLCRLLPIGGAGAVLIVAVYLVSRPWWQAPGTGVSNPVVEQAQRLEGLPVDGFTKYDQYSVVWTSWWVGWIALAMCLVVSARLAYRLGESLRDGKDAPIWVGPFLVGLGSSLLTWLRPAISPDHPWADRRFTIVLAFVIVCHVVGCIWILRSWRPFNQPVARVLTGTAVAGLLVPMIVAVWPHATERSHAGELSAIQQGCEQLGEHEVVLTVDARASYSWPQVLRGMCGVPAIALDIGQAQTPSEPREVITRVHNALSDRGLRLVLAGTVSAEALSEVTPSDMTVSRPEKIVGGARLEDPNTLMHRPDHLALKETTNLWIARLDP